MTAPTEAPVRRAVRAERQGGILFLTIDRPERRNALNREVWLALGTQIEEAALDTSVRAVILTGTGEHAFAAGADIHYLRERSVADVLDGLAQDTYECIERLPKPVIAAVNGVAFGGGSELALACDIRIASSTARFSQPEVNLGLIPGAGGTQRLIRTIGIGRAKELLLTGRSIDAHEAYRIGLVSQVVEPPALMEAAIALAGELINKSPLALALVKLSVQGAQCGDQRTGMLLERLAQAVATASADAQEGLAAFAEKRTPTFRGS